VSRIIWLWWFFPIITWIFAFTTIRASFRITKEKHAERFGVYIPGEFGFLSFFFDIHLEMVIGQSLKQNPWWITRTIFFAIGIGLFLLGFYFAKVIPFWSEIND
jgi:hypothetical protein